MYRVTKFNQEVAPKKSTLFSGYAGDENCLHLCSFKKYSFDEFDWGF